MGSPTSRFIGFKNSFSATLRGKKFHKGQWYIVAAVLFSYSLLTFFDIFDSYTQIDYTSIIKSDEDMLYLDAMRDIQYITSKATDISNMEGDVAEYLEMVNGNLLGKGMLVEYSFSSSGGIMSLSELKFAGKNLRVELPTESEYCIPEDNNQFCYRHGKNCGTFTSTDNCGEPRTANCGTCTSPNTCGGGGVPNICGCSPSTCGSLGKNCDTWPDGCGGTLNCGSCSFGYSCIEGICEYTCVPENDTEFCSRYGKNCGTFTSTDNCGEPRTANCGTCTSPNTCGGGGVPNICGCSPSTCGSLGKNCDTWPDGCGGTLNCGSCSAGYNCINGVCTVGWCYRMPITLTNGGGPLTSYAIKIDVAYVPGKMKADFSDIRFTLADGTTQLSHWRESYVASSSAVFWVKVNSIPSGSSTIYVHYGNSAASSASNGDNTFLFFDDFAGTSLNTAKWIPQTSGAGTITVNNGITLNNPNLNSDTALISLRNSGAHCVVRGANIIEFYGRLIPNPNSGFGFALFVADYSAPVRYISISQLSVSNTMRITNQAGPGSYSSSTLGSFTSDMARWKFYGDGSSTHVYINDNHQSFSSVYPTGMVCQTEISVGPRTSGGRNPRQVYLSWFVIRKFSNPEPTATIGAEQNVC
jgi:hypothetical protein